MTRKEIIDGLKFTVDMFLFDPSTGETYTEPRNDMDKTTIDACKGAIELLEQTDGDLISRQAVNKLRKYNLVGGIHTVSLDDINKLPSARGYGDLISRAEAIKMFTYNHKGERISDYDCDNFPVQIDIKTVKKVLRDLPPVTPRQDGDLISRKQAVDKMKELVYSRDDLSKMNEIAGWVRNKTMGYVIQYLNELPSAEKTAEWITKWDEEEREERHYCTNCGNHQLFKTEFCSHCGAKMKKKEEEGE